MIFVDRLRPAAAPWKGGVACHMTSDASAEDLQSFAASLGIPLNWFQPSPPSSHPHFDLSPRLRAKAIAAGARAVDHREYVRAVQRWRNEGGP